MTTVALGVRIVAALHEGVTLVARPHGVVHFHAGALTRGGGAVPGEARPFCGVRTRRLRVVGRTVDDITAAVKGRRFCRSCTRRLPARLGADKDLTVGTREEWEAVFGDLTVTDLRLAAAWAQTVEETHQVQRLLMLACGPRPRTPRPRRTPAQVELVAAYDAVNARRHHLELTSRTPDQVDADTAAADARRHNQQLVEKNRRREIAVARATERQLKGSYLLPHERELLADTA